ncbi:hypothetical protein [Halobacillus massiliensis]|uniref:hypothetical protein n=1 Tax=Halobacillus massiliensis TaxID=1926286 RepID=UPI0009E2B6BE|nr:hypothetical protein [Halobacillus massiliensis]
MSKMCRYCFKHIRDRDELVTASNWFRLRPFHYRCFELLQQDTRPKAGTWNPVNGSVGTGVVIVMAVISIWMFTTGTLGAIGDIIGVLALYPIILRLLSYIIFELPLPKFIENKKDN